MCREIRRVPKDWQHPKDKYGQFIPLLNGENYAHDVQRWDEGKAIVEKLERAIDRLIEGKAQKEEWIKDISCTLERLDIRTQLYEELAGERPCLKQYMPLWEEKEKTHVMMYRPYKNTPISPAFENCEDLAYWLAENKVSAMAGEPATYQQWLWVCRCGRGTPIWFDPDGNLAKSFFGKMGE